MASSRGGSGRKPNKFAKFKPKKRVVPDQPLEYKNIEYLQKFISPTGKLISRRRTGFDGQNQRKLAAAVKQARFIGLLPFVGNPAPDTGERGYRDGRDNRERRGRPEGAAPRRSSEGDAGASSNGAAAKSES